MLDIDAIEEAIGKRIESLEIRNGSPSDELILSFSNDASLRIWDDDQCCCETRYMTTDDDLSAFEGAVFMGLDLRDGRVREDRYGFHEEQFLIIKTSKGEFTLVTHNEHNGYYGGFCIRARWHSNELS